MYALGMDEKPRRAATSNASDKFIVRLPDGMRSRIAEAAAAAGRTMNAEVVHRLQASFEGPGDSWADHDLALRVEEARVHAALDSVRSEMRTARLHADFLSHSLAVAQERGNTAEAAALGERMAAARAELRELESRQADLLNQAREVDRRYQDVARPVRAAALAIAERELAPEMAAAQEREALRMKQLRELNPTQEELDAILARRAKEDAAREADILRAALKDVAPSAGKRTAQSAKKKTQR